jgi:uncharacterized membrane protein YgcG
MRKYNWAIVVIFLWVVFAIFPSASQAQSPDQVAVVDDARIFGDKFAAVETAAAKVHDSGADIRVRTILNYGSAANLDVYEQQLEKQSPSWLGQDGNRKNNLIVLMISLEDRETGLYYGSYWDNALSSRWMTIQTESMNPLFKSGEYASGVIKGLDEIGKAVKGAGVASTSISTSVATAAPAPTVSQPAKSSSAGWIVLIVVLVVVFLIVGLVWLMLSRQKRAQIQSARQRALLAKQAAASGINELLQTTQMLEIKVNVTSGRLADEDGTVLRDGLEKAKILVSQGSQKYSDLAHSAGDPENPKLGVAELGVLEPEYQKIVENIKQARESVKSVEDRITSIQQTIDGFSGQVTALEAKIKAIEAQQDQLKQSGFKTNYASELIAQGRLIIQQAQAMVTQKRYSEGLKYLAQAEERIKQAAAAVADLPLKKQQVEAAIPVLAARIKPVQESVERGHDVFERVFKEYAETTWESVKGNGTEAENRVSWTMEALEQARSAAAADQQEWQKGLDLVEKGNRWLNEVEVLMKSITDLDQNLQAARRDSPIEIRAAQNDVTTAWDYIKLYDDDIRESLEDDLRAAEKKIEMAAEELKQTQPDYFKVCKLAREANEAADKILIQARDEHETAERLRVKSATVRRDASTRVSIARQYIDVHSPEVRQEARTYLANAIQSLNQADAAADINTQLSLASNAESSAERAYSIAQSDVRNSSVNVVVAPVFIPPMMRPPVVHPRMPPGPGPFSGGGGFPGWGSSRPSGPPSGGFPRSGGGGSTGWSSRGGGGGRHGGGSTGW